MARASSSSNKAKIARRVIEVLEYFDENHREATVMDIVRRYDRPQSSTSELLSSLVELGLLYKDAYSRSYSLAPRAALLGASSQTGSVRDGRLVRLIDRLAAQTGLGVALFGMVGLNTQVVSWRAGGRGPAHHEPAAHEDAQSGGLSGGMQEPLLNSAAGWLLLSAVAQPRRDGMVRRLIAEAPDGHKLSFSEIMPRIAQAQAAGAGIGPAGFGAGTQVVAMLLPDRPADHPLAIGLVHAADAGLDPASLRECIEEATAHCLLGEAADLPSYLAGRVPEPLVVAA